MGGDFQNCVRGWDTNYEYLDWTQDNIKEKVCKCKSAFEAFCFADFEGHNCLFFFLGDGDNPQSMDTTRNKIYTNDKGEEVYYKRTDNSFSEVYR